MRTRRGSVAGLVLAAMALLAGCAKSGDGAAAPGSGGEAATHAAISQGQEVKLEDHLVKGQTTLFDFSSKYCPPCMAIAPVLAELDAKRDDLTVVTVDINRPDVKGIDWASPVARQYGLQSIPHFKIYGPDGTLQAEGEAAAKQVEGWLDVK